MKKIANVIYEKELVNHTKCEYIEYIKEPISIEKINNQVPTIYVGWNFFKNANKTNELPSKVNILDKRIVSNELYWEFSFDENKSEHVNGVEIFTKKAPEYYFKTRYRYTNIDPVFFNIYDINDLEQLFPKKIDYYYQYKSSMIYFLHGNNITGIDLEMYGFFDFNTNQIIELIKSRSIDGCVDEPNNIYQSYYKIFPEFEYLKRYLVVLLSKD